LEYIEKGAKVKGGGRFLAYLGESPKKFQLNGSDAPFRWLHDGKLILNLAWVQENGRFLIWQFFSRFNLVFLLFIGFNVL